MLYLTQTDITNRLLLTQEYISDFGKDVANQFFYNQSYRERNFKTLALLVGYVKVLTCYQPITGNITEEDNCITETEAQAIFDHISFITEIAFASIGTTYA